MSFKDRLEFRKANPDASIVDETSKIIKNDMQPIPVDLVKNYVQLKPWWPTPDKWKRYQLFDHNIGDDIMKYIGPEIERMAKEEGITFNQYGDPDRPFDPDENATIHVIDEIIKPLYAQKYGITPEEFDEFESGGHASPEFEERDWKMNPMLFWDQGTGRLSDFEEYLSQYGKQR